MASYDDHIARLMAASAQGNATPPLRPPESTARSDTTNTHSTTSKGRVMAKRREKQAKETAEAAAEALSAWDHSPWNTATSPMLTCLHGKNHFHSPGSTPKPMKRNKRSFSFDDTRDLDHLLQPTLITRDEVKLLQTQEMNNSQQEQQQQGLKPILAASSSSSSSSNLLQDEKQKSSLEEGTPIGISILYGLINATIVLPVLMSFGSIIYRDVAFQPYLNVLIKMTVVSGVVHQLCFSTLSSLPFAVGQVQDAGLIFLSSMAATLVETCRARGADDETLLATATVGLSLSTALLGLALVLIGRLKLAQWVQVLPTCVVGGYLAFIGFFCGMSGVGLMAGSSKVTWAVFTENLHFILPGICGGIFIYSLVRLLRHMAVLPTCIAFLFCLFYFVLWLRGISVEEATTQGWIAKTEPPPVWYHSW